ncbi:MAG TPA: 16S rRNA (uracil(1498)-N(3))-methyltransferase [Rhodanobacteraceae bacterium]
MRQIRLYVDTPLADVTDVALPADAAGHAVRVLRLGAGDAVTLFNGDGRNYAAMLTDVHGKQATARIQSSQSADNEPPWPLTLAQCLARGDKMDLVVQKATELGASRIVPLVSERSEVRLDAQRAAKRVEHWRAIAIAACEQCGRARIPHIDVPQPLDSWLDGLADTAGLHLALLPDAVQRVRDLVMPAAGATLVIGPEGGLGKQDINALLRAQFTGLSLGPRILRTETAGLATLSALLACHGDG